jgi:DNA-binding NtrC family response regulator
MAQLRPAPPADPTERLLGASPAITALRAQLRHLAAFDTPGGVAVPTVLLQGETRTGKGLIARLLHDSGPRARSTGSSGHKCHGTASSWNRYTHAPETLAS